MIDDDLDDVPMVGLKLCGRCYDDVAEVFPANCDERPEGKSNAAVGMYHCPDCGAMILAGLEHPPMCSPCITRTHPRFDP